MAQSPILYRNMIRPSRPSRTCQMLHHTCHDEMINWGADNDSSATPLQCFDFLAKDNIVRLQ